MGRPSAGLPGHPPARTVARGRPVDDAPATATGGTQQTDVVTLNADLLDVSEEQGQYIASVRFHGAIRETEGAAPAAFDEAWHLTKPSDGSRGWVIAGIQQFN